MLNADASLARLREGNKRFVLGESDSLFSQPDVRREQLVEGQNPHAVILGCADSRVPAELVFDQHLGDLFVVRVAGNVVAPSQIGSIEYAVAELGTPLIVVLGHTHCGAVSAAVDELVHQHTQPTPALDILVSLLKPAIIPLLGDHHGSHDELLARAVRSNIDHSIKRLLDGSKLLRKAVANGQIRVVGAEYSLATGDVEFLL